jgi:hypothetical protein
MLAVLRQRGFALLWVGLLALVGGGCWVAKAAFTLWFGVGRGSAAGASPVLDEVTVGLYRSGPVWMGLALIGLCALLPERAKGLGSVGKLLAGTAAGAGVLNLAAWVVLLIAPGASRAFFWTTGFVAFVALFCAVTLVGAATLVGKTLGRWSALPLAIALLGPGLILAAPFARAVGQRWFAADVPLLAMGFGWIFLGWVLLATRRDGSELIVEQR